MTFTDRTPIRDVLLKRVYPLIEKYKGAIVVRDYDIVLQSWPVNAGQPNQFLASAWSLVLLANGAIMGEENYLSFVWTFGNSPQLPNALALEQGVRETFVRLRHMQSAQLRQSTPQSPN